MGRIIAAFAQFFDGDGDPLADGWLKFLESGSNNTLKNTFSDSVMQIPNTNPVQLDGEGRCPNVYGTGNYRVISYTQNVDDEEEVGEQIQMFDPVTAEGSTIATSGFAFGEWNTTVTYDLGDIVSSGGNYYRSLILNNLSNNPATSEFAWERVDFIPWWNSSITYSINAIIQYDEGLYISLAGSNLNNNPSSSPTWWQYIGGLNYWGETGSTFLPNVSGYNIGDNTYKVGNIFISSAVYVGSGFIGWDGPSTLRVSSPTVLVFQTNTTDRWFIDFFGNFLPWADNTYDLGSSTEKIVELWLSQSGIMHLGSDAEIQRNDSFNYIAFNGWHDDLLFVAGSSGDSNNISFTTNGNVRWTIDANGYIMPEVNNVYDIGSATYMLANLYATNCRATNFIGSYIDISSSIDAGTTVDIETSLRTTNRVAPAGTFVDASTGEPAISNTTYNFSGLPFTWTSVGPTGSGASNIWTALDDVPVDADWIEIRMQHNCEDSLAGAGVKVTSKVFARTTGSSASAGPATSISKLTGYEDSSGNNAMAVTVTHKINIDSSRRFDIQLDCIPTTVGTTNCYLFLTGWGFNPIA